MSLRQEAIAAAHQGARHHNADILQALLRERFCLTVVGDDIYYPDGMDEARAFVEGITWAAADTGEGIFLSPILRCPRCKRETPLRFDTLTIDVLGALLDTEERDICPRCEEEMLQPPPPPPRGFLENYILPLVSISTIGIVALFPANPWMVALGLVGGAIGGACIVRRYQDKKGWDAWKRRARSR